MPVILYDSFGRELKPEKRPEPAIMAAPSLADRYGGYPSKGLTGRRLGRIFSEADRGSVSRQAELFEEMEEKDTHLFSILQTRKLSVVGLKYEVMPFSENTEDLKVADFVSEVISSLPDFEDNLLDLLDAIGKGFSALEAYWDVRKGKNVVTRLERVSPRRFSWATSFSPRLLTEAKPFEGIDPPAFKFLFHLHKTKSGHPTRQGVLRVVAWMYLFKNYALKDWSAFAEVFGMPLRLGKYDASATKEDKEALLSAVSSLGTDGAGIISKTTEIEFKEAVKNAGKDNVFATLAGFCNAEMSKAVLGQTMTAESGSSLSQAQVHNEVRHDLRQADCAGLAKTLRSNLIRPLVGFNFGWDTPLPRFRFHSEDPGDLEKEAKIVQTLGGLPGFAEEIPLAWLHEKFSVPIPEKGEKTLRTPTFGPAVLKNQAPVCPVCLVNKSPGNSPADTDTVTAFYEQLMTAFDYDPLMEPVARLLSGSSTLEEIRDRLLDTYSLMDESRLGEIMQQAFTAAELSGRYEAGEEA